MNNLQSETCVDCQKVIVKGQHTQEECGYNKWRKTQDDAGYKFLTFDKDTHIILADPDLKVEKYEWPIRDSNGFSVSIAVPKWLDEALNNYYSAGFDRHMELKEFLEKVNPNHEHVDAADTVST